VVAWVAIASTIGTGGDTVTATDTFGSIYYHKAVVLLISGSYGAGLHTRRLVALHALTGLKLGPSAVKASRMLHPVPPGPFWNIIFNLAGDHTGLAVKTLEGVNHHGISITIGLFHVRHSPIVIRQSSIVNLFYTDYGLVHGHVS